MAKALTVEALIEELLQWPSDMKIRVETGRGPEPAKAVGLSRGGAYLSKTLIIDIEEFD